jgi:SAM-dependent methyltransferase
MQDKQTHNYFDKFTPHYDPKRFSFALNYLVEVATDEETVLDIGCGDGATLYLIKENTPLKNLVGLDISKKYLRKAEKLLGCDTIEGSILDKKRLEEHLGKFDYCILGAVIHHLIGKNRKESFNHTKNCLRNSIELLKPGGTLIIFEPTHSPSMLMDLVFWIKKIVVNLTNKRVEILQRWANIGQPVVSYYTPEQLISFIESIPDTQLVAKKTVDKSRLGFIISRVGMGIIIKKIG